MWGKTQTQADTPEKASKGSVKMPALNEYYKFLKSDKEVRASPEKRSNELTRSKTTPPVAARSGNVETTTKSRKHLDKEAPGRAKRGDCPMCSKGVYSDESRELKNGSYYHDECIAESNKMKNSITKETANGKQAPKKILVQQIESDAEVVNAAVHRGDCGVCEKGVFSNQPRKFENDNYYHEDCLRNLPVKEAAARKEQEAKSATEAKKKAEVQAKLAEEEFQKKKQAEVVQIKKAEAEAAKVARLTADAMAYAQVEASASMITTNIDSDTPMRRGECGVCHEGVFTNQPRKYEDGTYYHDECLPMSTSAATPSNYSDGMQSLLKSSIKTRTNTEIADADAPFVPSTARVHDDSVLVTVRFSEGTLERGDCGVCQKMVYTDQLRTYEDSMYYHDDCLFTLLSQRLASLDADSEEESPNPSIVACHEYRDQLAQSLADDTRTEVHLINHVRVGEDTKGADYNSNDVHAPQIEIKYLLTEALVEEIIEDPQVTSITAVAAVAADDAERHLGRQSMELDWIEPITATDLHVAEIRKELLEQTQHLQQIQKSSFSLASCSEHDYGKRSREDEQLVEEAVGPQPAKTSAIENQVNFGLSTGKLDFDGLKMQLDLLCSIHAKIVDSGSEVKSVKPLDAVEVIKYQSLKALDAVEAINPVDLETSYVDGPVTSLQTAAAPMAPSTAAAYEITRAPEPAAHAKKSLIECCSSLAPSKTPRRTSSDSFAGGRVPSAGVESPASEHIIPTQFLRELRETTKHPADTTEGLLEFVLARTPRDTETLMLAFSDLPATKSDRDSNALLQAMSEVSTSLNDSAQEVSERVLSPRSVTVQLARIKHESEAENFAFEAVQAVLDQIQAAESSMSDEDLANILEEMGKITKRWSTDRNQLVTDLTKARHESEEMKTLALTACNEASSVVQRAKAQAQSRLEAKKKVKAENKVLSQKNLALIKTCTVLTEQHTTELKYVSEGYIKVKGQVLMIRGEMRDKMREKLDLLAVKLMKTVVVEGPFLQWVAVVRAARLDTLEKTSAAVAVECDVKCERIQEEEAKLRDEMREELLRECAVECTQLKQAHEQEIVHMRTVFESERTRLLEAHEHDVTEYKHDIETLREILVHKMETIAWRLMRNCVLETPFQEWASYTAHSKRLTTMESKVEARRRALTLYTAFIGWEIVLESASNQNTIAIETTTSDEFAEKAQILNTHIQERESARACARACVCAQTSNDLSALETPAARDVHVDIRASGESVASENKFFTPSSPQMQPPRTLDPRDLSPVCRVLDVSEDCGHSLSGSPFVEAVSFCEAEAMLPSTPPIRIGSTIHQRPGAAMISASTPSRTTSSSSHQKSHHSEKPSDDEQELQTLREQIANLTTANLQLQQTQLLSSPPHELPVAQPQQHPQQQQQQQTAYSTATAPQQITEKCSASQPPGNKSSKFAAATVPPVAHGAPTSASPFAQIPSTVFVPTAAPSDTTAAATSTATSAATSAILIPIVPLPIESAAATSEMFVPRLPSRPYYSAASSVAATTAPSVVSLSPSASSFVTNSSALYSSVSGADDNKSVTSSCMRSNRSTRSSAVWASKTRVGIGAYFQRSEALPDALEVKSILANSPAHACKLVSVGDFIIAVDGELVGGKSLSQLAEKVLGTPHSLVEISFRQKDTHEIYSVSLERGATAS